MRILDSFRQRSLVVAVIVTMICGLAFLLMEPCLFIESEQGLLSWFRISPNSSTFSLRFIHSVERTPVVENYVIDQKLNLVLTSTEYESFGVGLPFLASEGRFYAQNGRFIMEMQRVFPSISLRTYPIAQLTLTANNRTYSLYQMLPSGSLIRISAGSWLSRIMALQYK